MIDSATISIQYIKKDDFTGSFKGMRYRLSKAGDGMEVVIWPGPYNYIKTPEQKKQRKDGRFGGIFFDKFGRNTGFPRNI